MVGWVFPSDSGLDSRGGIATQTAARMYPCLGLIRLQSVPILGNQVSGNIVGAEPWRLDSTFPEKTF
jgi:hypothetical protein